MPYRVFNNWSCFMDWQFVSGCSPPRSLDDALPFDYYSLALSFRLGLPPTVVGTLSALWRVYSETAEPPID